MKKIILNFYECEHHDDLNNYASDVVDSGGVVESKALDYEDETGTLECSVPLDFWPKFKTTNAYEFLEGI
jgi:hypothetical protein